MNFWTVSSFRKAKGSEKLACLTAYDTPTAKLLDAAGIPLILVGDSLGMTALGYADTLSVTMDQMLHHTAAVARGVNRALVVGDMPFMACSTRNKGLSNAGRFLREGNADAVKIEGGMHRVGLIRKLVQNGIPVMGHLGLLPQSVRAAGGYRVQGRTSESAEQLLQESLALEAAGAFALVLECVPADVAKSITQQIGIPTIGIGAGPDCDGQILVTHDLLGVSPDAPPRFVKPFANLSQILLQAFGDYAEAVRQGAFPDADHSY